MDSIDYLTDLLQVVGPSVVGYLEFEDLKNLWLCSKGMKEEVGEFRLENHQKEYLKRFIVYQWNTLVEEHLEPTYAPTSTSYSPPLSSPPSPYPDSEPMAHPDLEPMAMSPHPEPEPMAMCHEQHHCLFGIQSFLRSLYYDREVFLTFNNLHLMFKHHHDEDDDINILYCDHLLTMW